MREHFRSIYDRQAEGYDRSCVEDGDCIVVFVGDTCSCTCERAGIRASERFAYQDDRTAASSNCEDLADALPCAPCPQVMATCEEGVCGVVSSE